MEHWTVKDRFTALPRRYDRIHERVSVGIEWEGLVEAENDDWRVKCVAANQADTYKSLVGRSSLVSAIVS